MSTRYPARSRERGPAPSAASALLHRGPQAIAAGAYAAGPAGAYAAPAPNAALLIDFDNVTGGIQKDLQAELRSLLSSDIIKGKVSVQRAYADWRRYPNYVVPLTENSIDLIFAPAYGAAKKNATDIRLAIDAMELVFTRPEIGTFILLSGDSDFSSLVIKLKEYGKYVIGVGIRESASDLLVQNCDEYYSYNALAGLMRTADEPQGPRDPWELVVEAVDRMARNGDTMRADRLKQVMQDMDPSFDEKNLGMPKFSRFVSDAASRGLLTLTRLESGQYEIAPARQAPPREFGARDVGRGRDLGRETPRETTRDYGRDREPARGTPRDAARDFARDLARDAGRDRDRVDSFDPTDVELAERSFDEGTADEDTAGEPGARGDRFDRSRPRRRGRTRTGRDFERGPRGDEVADDSALDERPAAPTPDIAPVAIVPTIGAQGERLTRAEAFDVVRRAVEALTTSDQERVTEQPLREQVFALLGRDSESLSDRMFPRIVQDASDNGIVRVFRDGGTTTVARVQQPAESVGDELSRAAAVTQTPAPTPPPVLATPAVPRGMGPRGAARGRGGRLGAPPPELLLIGAVPTAGGASVASPAVDTVPIDAVPVASNVGDAAPVDPAVADSRGAALDASAGDVGSGDARTAADTIGDRAAGTDATDAATAGVTTPDVATVPSEGAPVGDAASATDEGEDAASGGDDDSAETAAEPAARSRNRRGRGRGRGGAGRTPATAAATAADPSPVAVAPAPEAAPAPATPSPAGTAGQGRSRGARKTAPVAAKVPAKVAAKTAAKRGARKRPSPAPAGGNDAGT